MSRLRGKADTTSYLPTPSLTRPTSAYPTEELRGLKLNLYEEPISLQQANASINDVQTQLGLLSKLMIVTETLLSHYAVAKAYWSPCPSLQE